ncbi:DUF3575 domain-containing protein [Chitinophaga barathri]|uniref:DUF3575 domain-containing protein n=1 Tax=Chitinophaga barathri TaxID=1647451 RepID=A0A3N4M4H6_9BACT|nr:DUF3575 domain-containing protein [Chitinophaga barathri]RPD37982.1 DUF3575 domain-containing protein [Chitinophaga barathri]
MKFLAPFLLLFASTFAYAQSESNNTIFPYHHQLKFSLFPLHDPMNSGFEFSYERQYNQRWATQLAFTILSNGLHEMFDTEKEYHGFKGQRISIEQKYFYPTRRQRSIRKYFAADLNWLEAHTIRTTYSETTPVNPVDRMNIDRTTVSLNFKYGYEIAVAKRFVLDLSAGPGLKYRKISNDKNYVGGWRSDSDVNKVYAPREEMAANFVISVKIGYMF